MSGDYREFLRGKTHLAPSTGIDVPAEALHPSLFPHQRDLTRWALRKGRCALFCDTGLGKTRMQLEWARLCGERTLILAPLSVARQTVAEAQAMGIDVRYARSEADASGRITVTNYEMLHMFDPSHFGAVVLDESSILKAYSGTTKRKLVEAWRGTRYKLCCTATPAPNDVVELCNHADFLEVMKPSDMLSTFFISKGDDQKDSRFRLKRHAREAFFRWLASWSVSLTRPGELGYSDEGYVLPPLGIHPAIVGSNYVPEGALFFMGLKGVQDRAAVRKATVTDRVAEALAIVEREPGEQWILWCGRNDEAEALEAGIPGSVEVRGAHSIEFKELAAAWFTGNQCLCSEPLFRYKLGQWKALSGLTPSTCAPTIKRTNIAGEPVRPNSRPSTTPIVEPSTRPAQMFEAEQSQRPSDGELRTQTHISHPYFVSTESLPKSTGQSSPDKAEGAPFASPLSVQTETLVVAETGDSTSTTATKQDASGDSFAPNAIKDSEGLPTIQINSTVPPCICGHESGRRVLISKPTMFGFGMNFQNAARMVFVGIGDSYEQYYQAIRRCYRFGQSRPVDVHIVLSEPERAVYENVLRKEDEHRQTMRELIAAVVRYERAEIAGHRERDDYQPTQEIIIPPWLATCEMEEEDACA